MHPSDAAFDFLHNHLHGNDQNLSHDGLFAREAGSILYADMFARATRSTLVPSLRSTTGPSGSKFETSGLQDLITVAGLPPTRGTHRTPVIGFKLLGIGVRDAAITYMEPHSIPSGGDWGLQRMAAVFFENTVGSTVDGCTFERNDGIAVMFSGQSKPPPLATTNLLANTDGVPRPTHPPPPS